MYRPEIETHIRRDISNENGQIVVHFALGKNIRTSSKCFPTQKYPRGNTDISGW
jgi:hypothetical protein